MKQRFVFLIVLFVLSSSAGIIISNCNKDPVPRNRISAHFSRHGDNPSIILKELYSRVGDGGYIYVAIYSLTDREIYEALRAAKERGVDVRIITDQGQIEDTKGQKEILENLKRIGVLIKSNRDNKNFSMHMKVSIINDRLIATGSYNYTECARDKNEENLLVIPAKVDKNIVQKYKNIFLTMWNDGSNYKDY